MATGAFHIAYDYELWVKLGSTSSTAPTSTSGLTRIFSLSDASVKGTSEKTSAIDYETGIGGRKDLITQKGYNIPCKMNVSLTDGGYRILKKAWNGGVSGQAVEWYRITPVKDGSTDNAEVHSGVAFIEGFDGDDAAGNVATVSFTMAGYGDLMWYPQGRALATITRTTNGSGLVNGTYNGVTATSAFGIGRSATLNITVSSNAVSANTVASGGSNYNVGDVFTVPLASIGGAGVAPTFTVATLA